MSGFSADWLALREPADASARSLPLVRLVAAALAGRRVVRAVDLGAGTGSNVRFLGRHLGTEQEWLLVDDDRSLLAKVPPGVRTCAADLAQVSADWFRDRDLVTASALLDLVSLEWLAGVVDHCATARAVALFALNYDGRVAWSPRDEDDDPVTRLVNAHQRTDKGFGPALGPEAGQRTAALFHARGYAVSVVRSDWMLPPDRAALQRELIDGWARAAIEMDPTMAARVAAWRARRHALVDGGTSGLIVGHEDVAAIPG
jgi:trans-aconitate methyltransferase